jgi:hypothetical protein
MPWYLKGQVESCPSDPNSSFEVNPSALVLFLLLCGAILLYSIFGVFYSEEASTSLETIYQLFSQKINKPCISSTGLIPEIALFWFLQ